jgi:Clp amino terminal domain, pathogenicity island component
MCPMSHGSGGAVAPDPHYYEITGRAAEIARALGSPVGGAEHLFLAMIRMRETVPARALAGLADLDALEAAILEARSAPSSWPPEDAVLLPEGLELDSPLRRAVAEALPEGTTFAFSTDAGEGTWMQVIGPGERGDARLTREVLNTALASLQRPTLDS